jgi:hypothetical protein
MNTDTRDPLRLIQSGLEKLGHSPRRRRWPLGPAHRPSDEGAAGGERSRSIWCPTGPTALDQRSQIRPRP